jgi:thioredoxin reductase (NADPH)
VSLIGHRLDPHHHALRDFLTRAAQPFEWLEADTPAAVRALQSHDLTAQQLPVVLDDDEVITEATVEQVAEAWRISAPPRQASYDLVIVGAGPAGLAAAVYAASDGLSTLLVEEDLPGGQASYTSMIENFFGFPEGIGGAELARLAGRQAERFGAELTIRHGASGGRVDPSGTFGLEVHGHRVEAPLLIAATGIVWRRLEVPGVEELVGRGVYYGAGRSEAASCEDLDVAVVGGGNSAGQAAMHLASAGARVSMLVRSAHLANSMSAYLVERIAAHPRIDVHLDTEVAAVEAAENQLAGVVARSGKADARLIPAQLMFVCIGGKPRTGWAGDVGVRTDPAGYVLTGPDLLDRGERPAGWPLARDPLALETSAPGLFAAGDVRSGSTKRVGGAVGEGAMAVALAHRRLEELAIDGGRG